MKFLEKAKASHKAALNKIFFTSEAIEEKYAKDLCDFYWNEIEELFKHLSPNNLNQGRKTYNVLEDHVEWCTCQGYKKSNINLYCMNESNWADQFVVQ
jgi:hypothetical protein